MPDPTALFVIDEADRLRVVRLEQVRNIFDHTEMTAVIIQPPAHR